MKGDFSRITFDPKKNFIQVLMQQGRVQLDADWNEQSDILLHYIQTLAMDLIGPHGGPASGARGFSLSYPKDKEGNENKKDLAISLGRYYVQGILCENFEENVSYFHQPYYQPEEKEFKPPFSFMAYLDVWERHVTSFEDTSLSEGALDGIDTTTRVQAIWQLKFT